MRLWGCIAAMIVVCAVASTSYGFGLEIAAGGWEQDPQGDLSFEPITSDDVLDLEKDLRFDNEIRVFGRVKVDMPSFIPNVYFMATPMHFEGDGIKSVQFTFGGQTFQQDVPFFSEVTMNHYDVALFYGLLGAVTAGVFNIDMGVNVRVVDFEARVVQETTSTDEKESFFLPVPMLYAGVQIRPFGWLALEAEGRGIAFRDDRYYSVIGRLKLRPVGPVIVAGGWRHDKIDLDEEGVMVDVEISGPFVEAGLEF